MNLTPRYAMSCFPAGSFSLLCFVQARPFCRAEVSLGTYSPGAGPYATQAMFLRPWTSLRSCLVDLGNQAHPNLGFSGVTTACIAFEVFCDLFCDHAKFHQMDVLSQPNSSSPGGKQPIWGL
jgi:hypothetical protein